VVAPADRGSEPAEVIAWAHGTTGVDETCAPTVLEDPFESGAFFALDRVLEEGWTLVASDYVGLGTSGPHPYLIGEGEGRSVLDAVRAAWPDERPIAVRISAVDWAPGGTTADDAVEVAHRLKAHGVDIIDVSSGQTVPHEQPEYGRMFQTPFSDRIRHEVGIPTITVGAVQGWDHVNTILASGRADLCAMARPHLFDPYLTLHAAAEQGWYDVPWPSQYRSGAPKRPDPNAGKRRR
jgi:tRNA-dihydrouridine synthase